MVHQLRLSTQVVLRSQRTLRLGVLSEYRLLSTERNIPPSYTFSKAFKEWMLGFGPGRCQKRQDELLRFSMPYYKSDAADEKNRHLSAENIQAIMPSGNILNEVRITNLMESDDHKEAIHLVMLHGYAASLGWFYKNFDGLIRNNPNTSIHALDMLGFGLSSKPKVKFNDQTTGEPLHIKFDSETLTAYKHVHKSLVLPDSYSIDIENLIKYSKNQKQLVESVESVYTDAIEEWRELNKLEKFDLLGHSLGGYMSLSYALKYPERVNKLILVSPGGVERSPFALSNPMIKETIDAYQSANSTVPKTLEFKTSHSPADYGFLGRYPLVKESFKKIWYNKISFFTILRLMGPWGPYNLSKYTFKKLARKGVIDDYSEIDLLTSYIYNTFTKKSFSETAIMSIFTSAVKAKYPMLDRIHDLKSKTLWLYGEFDWMYNDCGRVAVKELNSRDQSLDGVEEATFDIVSKAGHNLYLDNTREFNEKVKRFLGWK